MEKDILIQNLKTKVGEDNCKVISDKTFDGIAESVLPMFADDSKITDETWKLPVATLIQFAGQKRFDEKEFTERFRADYAKEYAGQHEKDVETRINAAVAKALEEYKKEHPENKGNGNGNGNGGSSADDLDAKVQEAVKKAMAGLTGADSEFGKMSATMNKFMQSQLEREKTAALNSVKSELKKHLLALKANNEACIDDALDDIEYGENPTFEGLKQAVISAYEKRYKRYYADGGKPFGGDGTGGNGGSNDFVKDRIAKLQQEAKDNADYAAEQEKTFC